RSTSAWRMIDLFFRQKRSAPIMRLLSSLTSLLFSPRGARSLTRRRRNSSLGWIEQLEDRCLLTTTLVLDINPGPLSSSPQQLTNVNGLLFFVADDGVHGQELWESDGTLTGTKIVKDIFPGGGSSFPDHLTAVGNTLFFTADDGVHGRELWKSDGTE